MRSQPATHLLRLSGPGLIRTRCGRLADSLNWVAFWNIIFSSTFGPSMRSVSAELPERGPLACVAAGWNDWQAEGWPLVDPLPDSSSYKGTYQCSPVPRNWRQAH